MSPLDQLFQAAVCRSILTGTTEWDYGSFQRLKQEGLHGECMLLKSLFAVLALLLAAESLFILMHRHPANRFKPVEGYDGVVAFDTATGQLCKTLRTKARS